MQYSLDYYKRRKRITQNQIIERKQINKNLQNQIDEFQAAYDKLGRIKKSNTYNADWVRNNSKKSKIAPNVQWRGKSKDKFDDIIDDNVKSCAKKFYQSIDDMQDEIGREIAKKKGEKQSGIAVLDGLNKTLNWLGGVIKNWTN